MNFAREWFEKYGRAELWKAPEGGFGSVLPIYFLCALACAGVVRLVVWIAR